MEIKYKVQKQHTCSQWTKALASLPNMEIWTWTSLWIVTPMSDLSQWLFCPSDVIHRQRCRCPMNPHLKPHRCSCGCFPLTLSWYAFQTTFSPFSGYVSLKNIYIFKKQHLKVQRPSSSLLLDSPNRSPWAVSLVAAATAAGGDVSRRVMRAGLWLRPSSSPPPRGDAHWTRASGENTDRTLPQSRSHRLILSGWFKTNWK